jgi:hypothetical protein
MEVEHLVKYVLYAFAVAIVMILVVKFYNMTKTSGKSQENMENEPSIEVQDKSHSMELKQPDIDIPPTFFDAGSGTVMSGPEFVPNQFMSPWYKAYTGNLQNYYLLDDGENGMAGLQFNQCSKSCCSEQYPLPFKMPVDSSVAASKDEFVPTNYTCNNAWQDSGCVCMTKKQANFIGSRGGNI